MEQRIQEQDNFVRVNLLIGEQITGRFNLSEERIEASAKILANILLDYARSGGDMNDLKPEKVFGRRKR